jgi:hypothetical protein
MLSYATIKFLLKAYPLVVKFILDNLAGLTVIAGSMERISIIVIVILGSAKLDVIVF